MTTSAPSPFPAPTAELTGGVRIPQLGFGTYKLAPDEATAVVSDALEVGYRHIDTAAMYGNEREVGQALAASGLPRDELFVTTKLNNPDHEPQAARDAFARSLDLLGLDHVDLYLIHWPMAATTDYAATWRTLTEFLADGRARAIGVSNFEIVHLQHVIEATGVVPAVNQVEVTPYLAQTELRAEHRRLGITTEAWSPLARGRVFSDEHLTAEAQRIGCTVAQLVLAWHLRRGDVAIPKTTSRERMVENAGCLDVLAREGLDEQAMSVLDGLDAGARSGSSPRDVELGSK